MQSFACRFDQNTFKNRHRAANGQRLDYGENACAQVFGLHRKLHIPFLSVGYPPILFISVWSFILFTAVLSVVDVDVGATVGTEGFLVVAGVAVGVGVGAAVGAAVGAGVGVSVGAKVGADVGVGVDVTSGVGVDVTSGVGV